MDQILWMFSFFPVWIYYLILICAILGLVGINFLVKFPFIYNYKLPFQVLMGLLLIFAIWMQGFVTNENRWKLKIKEMEEKIALTEEHSKKENIIIKEKIIEKIKEIKVKGDVIFKEIPVPGKIIEISKDMSAEERAKFANKINEYEEILKNCPMPELAVEIHNKAALINSKSEKK